MLKINLGACKTELEPIVLFKSIITMHKQYSRSKS